MEINFCSKCGLRVSYGIPPGDDHERHYCRSCGNVHYDNPRMVVGTLPYDGDRILLCRRAIDPCYGLWTLPAGYLENGETVTEGAIRETYEEARANVTRLEPYSLYSIRHISQIYLIFRAELTSEDFGPGPESLEVELLEPHKIPWDEIAFRAIKKTLRSYVDDLAAGRFALHVGDIEPFHQTQVLDS